MEEESLSQSISQAALEGKERILREAERLFSQRGYQAVSIRELAQACGMTNAALYYHFQDKEDIFYQMARRHFERLASALQAALDQAEDDPRARFLALGQTYAAHLRCRQDSAHVFAEAMRKLGPERAQALQTHFRRHVLKVVVDALRAGQAAGQIRALDPALAAEAFLNLLGVLRFHMADEPSLPEIVAQLVDYFLHGVLDATAMERMASTEAGEAAEVRCGEGA